MKLQFDPAGQQIRGPNSAEDFAFSLGDRLTGTPTSVTQATTRGSVINTNTTSGVDNNANVTVSPPLVNPILTTPTFTALTPAVATIDATGSITRVADGLAQFRVALGSVSREFSRQMTHSGQVSYSETESFVSGSLGKDITDNILALVAAKTAQGTTSGLGGSQNQWSAATYGSTPSMTANTNFFASSLDFSCVSVYTSAGGSGYQYPAVLITSRHIVCALHVAPADGSIVVFRTNSGTYESRTILSHQIGDPDRWVGLLSSPITTISPALIVPSTFINKINVSLGYPNVPAILKTVHLPDSYADNSNAGAAGNDRVTIRSCKGDSLHSFTDGHPTGLQAWTCRISSGDSGSPAFYPITQTGVVRLALMGQMAAVDGLGNMPGAWAVDSTNPLQTLMDTLKNNAGDGAAYPLQFADLSAFPTY